MRVHSESSDKPPLLWLHGYTLDSSIWDDLWALLPNWHHVGLDLPGHGASTIPPGFEVSVQAVLDSARRLESRHLVAMSFGGSVALAAMRRSPDLFQGAVLAAPGLPGGPVDEASEACNIELTRLAESRGIGPWLADRWLASPPRIFDGLREHPRVFSKVEKIVRQHSFAELRTNAYRDTRSHALMSRDLRLINTQLTLIVGEHDMRSFRRIAEIVRQSSPRCVRTYLPSLGHLPLLEAPETCAKLIDRALTDLS